MITYKVKGGTYINRTNIDKDFTNEKDAVAYIKKLGAKYGVHAQIIKIEEGCRYEYSYNPDREDIIKKLEATNISYELDDSLNIKITF